MYNQTTSVFVDSAATMATDSDQYSNQSFYTWCWWLHLLHHWIIWIWKNYGTYQYKGYNRWLWHHTLWVHIVADINNTATQHRAEPSLLHIVCICLHNGIPHMDTSLETNMELCNKTKNEFINDPCQIILMYSLALLVIPCNKWLFHQYQARCKCICYWYAPL